MWICRDCRNSSSFTQRATEVNLVRQWATVEIKLDAEGNETDRDSIDVSDEDHYEHEEDIDHEDVLCSECEEEAEDINEDEYDELVEEWENGNTKESEGKITNIKKAILGDM